jgi:uncharacterized alpha-E superfamily protein
MLSRVADTIYWLNRYIERADNVARFVDVNLNLMLDLPSGTAQQWEPLVLTTGDRDLFCDRYGDFTQANVIQFLTFDSAYPNSILSCLRMARENARSIREIISSEMWEQVNAFYIMVNEAALHLPQTTLPNFFNQVKLSSHRFAGVMDATMTHNEGWHFGQMGRLQERADKTARMLDVKYYYLDQIQSISLLRSTSAYEMYRKCEQRITPNSVAEFLILNREFPRSIHFCLKAVQRSLHEITGTALSTWNNSAEREIGRLCAELSYLTIEDIIEIGLHEFLDQIQGRINQVGIKMSNTFFVTEIIPPVPIMSQSLGTMSQSMG